MDKNREGVPEGDAQPVAGGPPDGRDEDIRISRGRHDIVESEDADAFWPAVDGMLTGEFSTDLLPKAGDYRLGAITDSFDPISRPPMAGGQPPVPPATPGPRAESIGDPFAFDELPVGSTAPGEPTGPAPPITDRGAADTPARRGNHDIDPDQLGFNVVGEDEAGFGAFVPDLQDGPFAVQPEAPEEQRPTPEASPPRNVPTVATESTRLFDDVGGLPPVGDADGGRLFPTDDDRSSSGRLWAPGLDDAMRTNAGGPLIDLTDSGTGRTPPPPVALERSTVVDPHQGPPAGSSFIAGPPANTAGSGPAAGDAAGHATAGQPAGNAGPGAPPTISLQGLQGPDRAPTAMRLPDKPPGPLRRDVILDLVDRQWFTISLVATATLALGLIGWLLFAGGDGGPDQQVVAQSTTTVDVSGSANRDAGAASANQTTTVASSTASTESVTSSGTVTTRSTNRPGTTAPTTGATSSSTASTASTSSETTDTSTSSSSSETTDTSTSSSSSETTDTSTSSSSSETTDTSDTTATTAGTTSSETTEDTSTSSSDSSSSSDPGGGGQP